MKKLLLGAIVGGILLFLWQFLSWTILNLHGSAYQYTEKQDNILNFLSSQFTEDGQYYMPGHKEGASMEEQEAAMKAAEGKPWAIVAYHSSMKTNMAMNMIRGFFVNVILVGLFCWIISRMNLPSFGTIFLASLFTGLIVFMNSAYTQHIWFESFDVMAHLTDALVSWGMCGLWLGWLYSRR